MSLKSIYHAFITPAIIGIAIIHFAASRAKAGPHEDAAYAQAKSREAWQRHLREMERLQEFARQISQ